VLFGGGEKWVGYVCWRRVKTSICERVNSTAGGRQYIERLMNGEADDVRSGYLSFSSAGGQGIKALQNAPPFFPSFNRGRST